MLLLLFAVCKMRHHQLFFFKQKTAYDRRSSDWSSDVCSSDLEDESRDRTGPVHRSGRRGPHRGGLDRRYVWRLLMIGLDEPWVLSPAEIGRASCRERVCQYV